MPQVIDGEKNRGCWPAKYITKAGLTTGQRNKIQEWLATKMSTEYVRLVLRKPGRKENKNTELLLQFNGMCARLPIRGRRKERASSLTPYFNSVVYRPSPSTYNLIKSTLEHCRVRMKSHWHLHFRDKTTEWLPLNLPLSGWSLGHLIPRLLPAAHGATASAQCSLKVYVHALPLEKWEWSKRVSCLQVDCGCWRNMPAGCFLPPLLRIYKFIHNRYCKGTLWTLYQRNVSKGSKNTNWHCKPAELWGFGIGCVANSPNYSLHFVLLSPWLRDAQWRWHGDCVEEKPWSCVLTVTCEVGTWPWEVTKDEAVGVGCVGTPSEDRTQNVLLYWLMGKICWEEKVSTSEWQKVSCKAGSQ